MEEMNDKNKILYNATSANVKMPRKGIYKI